MSDKKHTKLPSFDELLAGLNRKNSLVQSRISFIRQTSNSIKLTTHLTKSTKAPSRIFPPILLTRFMVAKRNSTKPIKSISNEPHLSRKHITCETLATLVVSSKLTADTGRIYDINSIVATGTPSSVPFATLTTSLQQNKKNKTDDGIKSNKKKKKKRGANGLCRHCKFNGEPIQWRFAEDEKVCNSCGLHYNKLKNHYKHQLGRAKEVFDIQEQMGLGHKRGNNHLELPVNYKELILKIQEETNTRTKP